MEFKSTDEVREFRRKVLINGLRSSFMPTGEYSPSPLPQKGDGDNLSGMDKFANAFSEFLKNYEQKESEPEKKDFFNWTGDRLTDYYSGRDKINEILKSTEEGKLKLKGIEIGTDAAGNLLTPEQQEKAAKIIADSGMRANNFYSREEYENLTKALLKEGLNLDMLTYTPQDLVKQQRKENTKEFFENFADYALNFRLPEQTQQQRIDRNQYIGQNLGDSQFAANENTPNAFESNLDKPFTKPWILRNT